MGRSKRWKLPNDTSGKSSFLNAIKAVGAKQQNGKWSAAVTHGSNALDLEEGVFKWDDPHRIALSLKRSAMRSHRRKAKPFQSAMSMLNFYINRAGTALSANQKSVLTRAKEELRQVFQKPAHLAHH